MKFGKLQKFKAVIWDLDGVLIDSESHYLRLEKEFLKRLGIEADQDVLKNYMGVPFDRYFPLLAEKYGSKISFDEAKKRYHEFIEKLYSNHVELTPHIKEVLNKLSENYLFALATSTTKKLADVILTKFSIIDLFNVRVHGDEVKNGKPDPEIFLKACSELAVKPEEAVVVEDSINGIKAGNAGGIKVIAYKTLHNKDLDFSLADFVVTDLREIPGILNTKLV